MRIFTFLLLLFLISPIFGGIIPGDEIRELNKGISNQRRLELLNSIVTKNYIHFPDTAYYYALHLEDLSSEMGNQKALVKAKWIMAKIHKKKGDLQKSVSLFFEAYKLYKALGQDGDVAITLYNIGQLFRSGNDYQNALLYYRKSLNIDESLNKTIELSQTYYEMARCFIKLKYFDSSLLYLNKSLQFTDLEHNKSLISKIYNNMGSTYFQKNRFDKAISYYLKSLAAAQGLKDVQKKSAIAYNNIGEAHLYNGKYEKANTYLTRALNTKQALGRPDFTLSTVVLLGKLKVQQQQYKEALAYLEEGIQHANQNIVNHNLMEALNEVIAINEASQGFKIPEPQLKLYFKLQNKQANLLLKFNDDLEGLNSQYVLKNAYETHMLLEEKEVLETRLSQTKLVVGLIILLALLIAIVSVWYFRKYLALKNFKKETSLNLELISHQLERTIRMASKK